MEPTLSFTKVVLKRSMHSNSFLLRTSSKTRKWTSRYAVMVLSSNDQIDFRKLLGVNRSCVGAKKVLIFVPNEITRFSGYLLP